MQTVTRRGEAVQVELGLVSCRPGSKGYTMSRDTFEETYPFEAVAPLFPAVSRLLSPLAPALLVSMSPPLMPTLPFAGLDASSHCVQSGAHSSDLEQMHATGQAHSTYSPK